jgi:hypothetical protein
MKYGGLMYLILEQCISLVSYGNYFLCTETVNAANFLNIPAFKSEKTIKSYNHKSKEEHYQIESWLHDLKQRGVKSLKLVLSSEAENKFAFLSDLSELDSYVLIEAQMKQNFELWLPLSKNSSIDSEPVWQMNFEGIEVSGSSWVHENTLHQMKISLLQSLETIKGFAETTPYYGWVEWFSKALITLQNNVISNDSFDLLPPHGYSFEAHHLAFCAEKSWVFGGMGSWNDLYFDDKSIEQEYSKVTERLFDAVMSSLLVATNSFDPDLL